MGDSCYKAEYKNDSLILIGAGTGLGPVYGIVKEALFQGHKGRIYLYHGVKNIADLYYHNALSHLMLAHKNVAYFACVDNVHEGKLRSKRIKTGDPFDVAMSRHQLGNQTTSSGYSQRVFLCAEPSFVTKGPQQLYVYGAPLERIHALAYGYKYLSMTR